MTSTRSNVASTDALDAAVEAMREQGVAPAAIKVFRHYWHQLADGATGTIGEAEIDPVIELDSLADLPADADADTEALSVTAVLKLNGGLGTSMGMTGAKSLLPVRGEHTFLDLIIQQVRHARRLSGASLPLVLMDSFRTREDSLAVLTAAKDLPVDGVDLDFLQSQEPKLRAEDLSPVSWPADPEQGWCPPGHGDLYVSLLTSGMLDQLRAAGFRYAFVSNSDNVGAAPSAAIAEWFAASGAPFAMEVCRRTAADRKGGHLATRRSDGRLVLREKAQVADADAEAFQDVERHRYFNTNSLWLDLDRLDAVLRERDGVLGLPMIRNAKTVDPSDPTSTAVVQIETAMGSAIEVFDGASAIEVPRSRFRPVKTTDDLLLLRSDAVELDDDGSLRSEIDPLPLITLSKPYATIAGFDERFADGPPSLREARSLTVEGDYTFGAEVTVRGAVTLPDEQSPQQVPDGTVLQG